MDGRSDSGPARHRGLDPLPPGGAGTAGILHAELVERAPSALRLRLWRDDPGSARERVLAPEDVAGLAALAERVDVVGASPGMLREMGGRLFRWLDGSERFLSAEIAASAGRDRVLALAIAAPPALARLPWEVLHDGAAFLVHAPGPPVVPVRWRPGGGGAHAPANRPLQALFMASSPRGVRPVLDYEKEEDDILAATRRRPLDLVVEESGSLEELGALMQDYGAGFFDVLHLTGHAGHAEDGGPVFRFEDGEGRRADATPLDVARLPHRPPLVFLSGCRTGERAGRSGPPSLAESLIASGFRAVLGWGRPVRDADAILASRCLYGELAAGETLPLALARAHAALREAGARDWHLLRLFCGGDPPGALVTPLLTPGRRRSAARPAESEFLDPLTRTVRVATRATFVGRRRLLQHALRSLRRPDAPPVGVLLHGQGGRGKSSVAARLCDRLRNEHRRVVVVGRLDEPALVNAWAPELPDEAARRAIRDPDGPLRFRIEAQLRRACDAGGLPPLFVLDDFERNQPRGPDGDTALAPHAAETLSALLEALEHTGVGRVLITGRYALPRDFARFVDASAIPPLDPVEQEKQLRRLAPNAGAALRGAEWVETARAAADGNPRLLEWLHAVLAEPNLDHAAILAELRTREEAFREAILARRLAASLPDADRELLGRMLLLRLFVPFAAVRALDPARSEADLLLALGHASDLGLVDVVREDGEPLYRVPRQLGEIDPPLLPVPVEGAATALAGAAFDVLCGRWERPGETADDGRAVELVRLAAAAGRTAGLVALAAAATTRWLDAYRYGEARSLLEPVMEAGGRAPALLLNLARAVASLGDGDTAGRLLREAEAACPPERKEVRAPVLFHLGRWLAVRGELGGAMRVHRDELLPMLDPARDARLRALTLREVADVLHRRGEVDEALRILREEVLPAFDRLNDGRERAVTLGEIADVLHARGELDEALRIRREEQLPVYERLGDARERTMALGKVADVLYLRGEVDEALRIRREEQLPVYEHLRDARQQAVVLGKIADIVYRRGEVDEALRIRREEQLPLFERLGDARGRAVALGKMADILYGRGEVDEALRIRREEQLPVFERLGDVRSRAVVLGKIAGILRARGEVDEALRIRREEELPALDQLKEVRARTRAVGKIGDLLYARGELDEALRIRREEQLPVYERLGDVHARAVTLGKVADVLHARGEVDEALRIRREEQLPVFVRLGDLRARAVALRKVAELLHARGEWAEAVRTLRDEAVPVLDRLGDVHELVKARLALARLLLDGARDEGAAEAMEHLAWCHHAAASRGYGEAAKIRSLLRGLETPDTAEA